MAFRPLREKFVQKRRSGSPLRSRLMAMKSRFSMCRSPLVKPEHSTTAAFERDAGGSYVVVGENGSGKSTLAKIISGVVRAEGGLVSVFGVTPKTPWQARRLGISTIFQEILLAEEATVADNLFVGSYGSLGSSVLRSQRRAVGSDILKRLALVDIDPDMRVVSLPLNMRQWLVIARALRRNQRFSFLTSCRPRWISTRQIDCTQNCGIFVI